MVAVNDPNGDRTASLIKRYGLYLASLPILSTALEVTSPMFAVEGILLNGYALHVASKFDKERSNGNARKVFLTSLWYLPCVMMLFLLHSRRWHEEEQAVTNDEKEANHIAIGGIYWIPSKHYLLEYRQREEIYACTRHLHQKSWRYGWEKGRIKHRWMGQSVLFH